MCEIKWKFNNSPNTMVISLKNILMDGQPILYVSHDEEDGMWQFLDDNELDTDNALIISLKEIIDIDPSIVELSDLPLGWIAWRENEKQKWSREKI